MGFFSKLAKFFKHQKHHTYLTYDYDLDEETIEANRERILSLLNSVQRQGIDKVINYMEKTNFFIVPATVTHHHRGRGGLADHSLSVYDRMLETDSTQPMESMIICGLLHDICKADKTKYDRKGGLHRVHGKGHGRGRRSVKILQDCGLELNDAERLAIRWHMGGNNAKPEEMDELTAAKREPLWRALWDADRHDSDRWD